MGRERADKNPSKCFFLKEFQTCHDMVGVCLWINSVLVSVTIWTEIWKMFGNNCSRFSTCFDPRKQVGEALDAGFPAGARCVFVFGESLREDEQGVFPRDRVVDLHSLVDDTVIRMVPETPLYICHYVFHKLGLRFVAVVDRGRFRGLITKKAFVRYCQETSHAKEWCRCCEQPRTNKSALAGAQHPHRWGAAGPSPTGADAAGVPRRSHAQEDLASSTVRPAFAETVGGSSSETSDEEDAPRSSAAEGVLVLGGYDGAEEGSPRSRNLGRRNVGRNAEG